ncbi:MAG: CpXC domain-containing protein [Anaerolineae bacterium]
MPFPAIPSQIRCPNCSTAFLVDVRTVIDVGQEPELKEQFLRGELNHAECPQCHTGGLLNTPLIYHDPTKSLLLAYVPSELGLSAQDQERTIGTLVNAVMNEMPAEQRKAYFFSPRTVLTYDGLFEAVLEGEGIDKNLLERQRNWLNLINDLVAAMDDEEAFNTIADDHLDTMDYEFFLLLADLIDGQEERAEDSRSGSLKDLRERLLNRVTPAMPAAPPQPSSAAELIDILLKAQGGPEWDEVVADYLPHLDYAFFQELTQRLESAQAAEEKSVAEPLEQLRSALLEAIDRQNQQMREAEDEASLLIMELLEADDLDAAVREREAQLDDVFFLVLARLRQTALNRKNESRVERLTALIEKARDVREEKLPPDVRLVSRLLRADYPDGSNQLLEEERGLVNASLLKTYDRYIGQVGENISEAAKERLDQIRGQIAAKVEVARA